MKFIKNWIKKYLINKKYYNIENILNNNGFECKNLNIKKSIFLKKFFIFKIKNFKKIKNFFSYIKTKNFFLKINFFKNIKNKYFLIYKKEINKNYILYKVLKKKINNQYIYIFYKNKKVLKLLNYLIKKNEILEIKIPNNRLDCNNIIGISKEISTLLNTKLKLKKKKFLLLSNKKYFINIKISTDIKNTLINNYKYIIVKNIKILNKNIPKYIKEKIKKLGFTFYNNIKDIINYILIESGQIINIFDFDKIKNNTIFITNNNNYKKKKIKSLFLLNKKKIMYKFYNFYNKDFIVNKKTKNIFIGALLLTKNFYQFKDIKINNNLYQYISNFDENIQNYALNNTYKIIKNTYEGNLVSKIKKKNLFSNKIKKIKIYFSDINKLIGFKIKKKNIINYLTEIKCKINKKEKFLFIKPPEWRIDLLNKEDLIEEIVKKYGYNNIPEIPFKTEILIDNKNKNIENLNFIKNIIINLGYQEVINFNFSNVDTENLFFKKKKKIVKILNPISNNMSIMRTSLIPNLIRNIKLNTKNQNNRIKIFEIGKCFKNLNNKFKEQLLICALIYGNKFEEHWSLEKKIIFDFYDIKGDLEYLIKKQTKKKFLNIEKKNYNFLEKNYSLNIKIKDKNIGIIGKLNHKIQNFFSLKYPIYLFEINLNYILSPLINKFKLLSKFPENKRDLTIIIDKNIYVNDILKECLLIDKRIKKVSITKIFKKFNLKNKTKKNITIRFIIQDNKKNLKDVEINHLINKCRKILILKYNVLFQEIK